MINEVDSNDGAEAPRASRPTRIIWTTPRNNITWMILVLLLILGGGVCTILAIFIGRVAFSIWWWLLTAVLGNVGLIVAAFTFLPIIIIAVVSFLLLLHYVTTRRPARAKKSE